MVEARPNIERDGADAAAVARGYEARDIRLRLIAWLLIGFVVVFASLCGGLWILQRYLTHRPTPPLGARSAVQARPTTDAPPLQPQPGHDSLDAWDLRAMRDAEDKTFAALGWQRDVRTHRFVVPPAVLATLQGRQATTQAGTPAQNGGR